MKIAYVANVRMPTEKAHGIQVMKTCEALARLGHELELIVPDRKTHIAEDAFSYYGVAPCFSVRRLKVWDTVGYGRIGFLFETLQFALAARTYLRHAEADVVYGRDELVLMLQPEPVVWESHTGAWNFAARRIAKRAKRIIVISQGLADFYVNKGVPPHKITVAHDGIDLEAFAHAPAKEDARAELKLPSDKKIIMYAGRLDGWKGTDTLLAASQRLPEEAVLAVIGGEDAQVESLSRKYPQVIFLGNRPYRDLPRHLAAADVLILPNTGNDVISSRFTSPLKLFAYMASGVLIVASDLPSIREVLDDQSAILVPPDDAEALASGIRRALEGGGPMAENALARVNDFTWARRAERIIAAITSK